MTRSELTRAERDVFDWLLKGHSNKVIGEKLFVSEKTIKFHATNIFKKFKVESRFELIVCYYKAIIDSLEAKLPVEEHIDRNLIPIFEAMPRPPSITLEQIRALVNVEAMSLRSKYG